MAYPKLTIGEKVTGPNGSLHHGKVGEVVSVAPSRESGRVRYEDGTESAVFAGEVNPVSPRN